MEQEFSTPVSPVNTDYKWAAICYLPFVNAITTPIVGVYKVNSRLCRFHSKQGLLLFGLWLPFLLFSILIPFLGIVLLFVIFVLHILGFYSAWNSSFVLLPVIGHISNRIDEFKIFTFLTGKKPEISATLNNDENQFTQ